VRLLTSPYAVEEAQKNLGDDKQRARLRRLLTSVELVHAVGSHFFQVDLPAKDEQILVAAIAGQASHLITGDVKHFGRFFGKNFMGILVLPPAQIS